MWVSGNCRAVSLPKMYKSFLTCYCIRQVEYPSPPLSLSHTHTHFCGVILSHITATISKFAKFFFPWKWMYFFPLQWSVAVNAINRTYVKIWPEFACEFSQILPSCFFSWKKVALVPCPTSKMFSPTITQYWQALWGRQIKEIRTAWISLLL